MTIPVHPPFSRPFAVSELRDTGHEIAITARPDERAELARIDGLVALSRLEADFRITRRGRIGLNVAGEVRASVTQNCVISLEPFEAQVREPISVRYDIKRKADHDIAVDAIVVEIGDLDPPELVVDGRIDLGALAAEFLALALDPYPRKPGAVLVAVPVDGDPPKISPFTDLKQKLEKKIGKL